MSQSEEERAFHVMAKPTGSMCNLDCKYCFFLSKQELYPQSSSRMSEEVLDAYLRQLLASQTGPVATVTWQGGEPTLMGLDFFRHSVELVEKYRRPGQRIEYSIQTNGTLIDQPWCSFLRQHHFLVGLSIDGPKPMHDAYRVNKDGKGSFDRVLAAWNLMRSHQVEVNILCTVHAANVEHPLEVYRFFRDELKAEFIQLIPIVERVSQELLPLANLGWSADKSGRRPLYQQAGDRVTDRSVRAEQFGDFLIAIFEEWVRRDVGRIFVQMFDATLSAHVGAHSLCIFAPTCGDALALEHNGDLYSCDHFVEPAYRLGNIVDSSMDHLARSGQQREFGVRKQTDLPQYCRDCPVRFACNGGCPKDRFVQTPDGESCLNYLCAGYRKYFLHVHEAMQQMAELLRAQRSPAYVMDWYAARDEQWRGSAAKMKGNELCPCGSGNKIMNCHAVQA